MFNRFIILNDIQLALVPFYSLAGKESFLPGK